ncbi:NSFL1 cofactor p47 [Blomia tropicalis]|nr:NSFL1 cofactor p47 [Blomia tropicalis]
MDETSNKNSLIEQFTSLTGVENNRATFFLESANWNFELAIQSFYENTEGLEFQLPSESIGFPTVEEITPSEDEMSDQAPNDRPMNPPSNKDNNNNQGRSRNNAGPNIATLSSLQNNDNDPGGQAFYAGGSEHSGQQVLGPKGRKNDSDKIVSEMFKQARENAEVVTRHGDQRAGPSTFGGMGFTLGSTMSDSHKISGQNDVTSKGAEKEEEEIILKLWQNGFSLDDGLLLSYDDPINQEFLAAIRRGEIPNGLLKGRSREVCLSMEDHRHEVYQEPKKKPPKAFVGEGHRLGTPASEIIENIKASTVSNQSTANAAEDANNFLKLNETEPSTKIQIRLADGERIVVQINLSRLVSDLRRYICISRPEYASLPFNLMTTFPNKVIEDESVNIKDSGLANSSLVQRLV